MTAVRALVDCVSFEGRAVDASGASCGCARGRIECCGCVRRRSLVGGEPAYLNDDAHPDGCGGSHRRRYQLVDDRGVR